MRSSEAGVKRSRDRPFALGPRMREMQSWGLLPRHRRGSARSKHDHGGSRNRSSRVFNAPATPKFSGHAVMTVDRNGFSRPAVERIRFEK